ncbi:hypothetical protein [Pseudomonas japonica]|uniref:hypothetical protein n=1 Tax=Pseudomonas japonica TaxID=256466 RepID=UPI0015E2926C|nr:hypothetical protein [Pseudomonas japonica]MBA1244883.1 hypothetical protein [Pseudomonas japonica]MBA1287159.1 hypothetical protein [Pseudomonas japonica]
MPVHPPRRTLAVRIPSLSLVLSIALGMWLGFLLILVTGWAAWHYGYAPPLAPSPTASTGAAIAPPRPIDRQPGQVPKPVPAQPGMQPPSDPTPEPGPGADEMFQHYQQNLHSQALRDAEAAARANPANQANPKCQFWLEQAQTAATDDSREQVARFCN